ncbi:hypothetical protein NL50_09775 [Clostridium acetobutylicum]|nr:hypothetical protein NL50_09775 [Clostridium acetobutylicum]
MKNLKLKALSLGIVSTVLISSSAFAATPAVIQNHPVPKVSAPVATNSTAIQTPTISKAAIHPSFNYGPNGGPSALSIVQSGGYIQYGDVGYAVKEVQWCLQGAGDLSTLETSSDGIFGQETYNALINFQKSHGLAADGIVGNATWTELFKYL